MARDHEERPLSENDVDVDVGSTSDAEGEHDDLIDINAHVPDSDSAERLEVEQDVADHSDNDEPAVDEPPEATDDLPEEIKAAGWNAACQKGADGKWYLPSGVTMVPGTGNTRRHEDSKSTFNYGKEVDTGMAGRKHATHENLMPKERKSTLSMPMLEALGFDPKIHLQDPLWFLLLLLPINTMMVMGKKIKGFWFDHHQETNAYAVKERKLGGSTKRKFVLRTITHMIRWWGVVYMDGVCGGSNGNFERRFNKKSECYNDKIYQAFKEYGGYAAWKQTKGIIKVCDNYANYANKDHEEYNPCYKYHEIYACNQWNTVNLLDRPPLDIVIDETTWAYGGYGESGAGVVRNIKGKKCGRGGQTVLAMEAGGRLRLLGFVHRHKIKTRTLTSGTTASGPNEALLLIEQLREMSAYACSIGLNDGLHMAERLAHKGLNFPRLWTDNTGFPHITADNHFYHECVTDAIVEMPGWGWLSTVPRGRMKQWKATMVHKAKAQVTARSKLARLCNAITIIRDTVTGTGTERQTVHVSMQSTGTANFAWVCSGTEDGVVRNYTRTKTRGKKKKYTWEIEMNTARDTYLKTYNGIDVADHYIKECRTFLGTQRYWVCAAKHAMDLTVACAYSMYNEVIEELVDPEKCGAKDRADLLKRKLDFFEFREQLARNMLAYDEKKCKYPGDEELRATTQAPRSRRQGRAAPQPEPEPEPEVEPEAEPEASTSTPASARKRKRREATDDETRFCSSLNTYHTDHGAHEMQGRLSGRCYVCYAHTTHKCKKCDAYLCPMTTATGKNCHAMYHDPLCKGLCEIDKGDRKERNLSVMSIKRHARMLSKGATTLTMHTVFMVATIICAVLFTFM